MLSSRFLVYGAALCFVTNSDEVSSEIYKDFGSFETKKSLKTDGEVQFIITDGKFPLEVPKYAIRESFCLPDRATYLISNQRFIEEENNYILRVDFRKNEVLGYARSTYNTSPFPFPARALLKWTLFRVLEGKGTFFIHGSGVTKNEISSFFVGPSGYGKTWVLISFLQRGYKMIADDTILLASGRVLPFHIRSRIFEKTLQRFPILKKGLNENSTYLPEQGWLIDLGDIFPVEEKEIQPSNLFSIHIWNSKETKVEKIPRKEMLSRLLRVYRDDTRNLIWFDGNREEVMRELFTSYYSLVENVDCYKVFAGSDVSRFMKAVEAVL